MCLTWKVGLTGYFTDVASVISLCVMRVTACRTISMLTHDIAEELAVFSTHLPKASTYLIGVSFYRPARF